MTVIHNVGIRLNIGVGYVYLTLWTIPIASQPLEMVPLRFYIKSKNQSGRSSI